MADHVVLVLGSLDILALELVVPGFQQEGLGSFQGNPDLKDLDLNQGTLVMVQVALDQDKHEDH